MAKASTIAAVTVIAFMAGKYIARGEGEEMVGVLGGSSLGRVPAYREGNEPNYHPTLSAVHFPGS